MPDIPDGPADDFTELVDRNGLVKLFANRVRARILVTLFYAEEPLTVAEIASGAGITQSVVHEALDPLQRFEILETTGDAEEPKYQLDREDELVSEIRSVAELATERFYDDEE